jgi:hypothetical protein
MNIFHRKKIMLKRKLLVLIAFFISVSLYPSTNTQKESRTASQAKVVLDQIKSAAIPAAVAGVLAFIVAPRLGWKLTYNAENPTQIEGFNENSSFSYCNPFYCAALITRSLFNITSDNSSMEKNLTHPIALLMTYCRDKASRLVGAGYAFVAATYLLPKIAPVNNDRLTKGLCAVSALAGGLLAPEYKGVQ